MSDVELKRKALAKWNADYPPLPSRKERRKAWRESRKQTHEKADYGMGTHGVRGQAWRDTWKLISTMTAKHEGARMRALFEAMYKPAKYLGVEEKDG